MLLLGWLHREPAVEKKIGTRKIGKIAMISKLCRFWQGKISLGIEKQSDLSFDLVEEIYYKNYSFLHNPAFSQKPEEANLSENFILGGLTHPKYQIRSFIALNKNTPVSNLSKLAKDQNWVVRQSVAANLNTPVKLQERLAKDCNLHVKLKLLEREDLSDSLRSKVSEELAKSQNEYIRGEVARNKNTPKNILSQLKNDSNPDVRILANKQILLRCFNLEAKQLTNP